MFLNFLMIAIIVIAIALIGLVLVQGQDAGLGTVFGGGDIYRSRRGIERTMFNLTFLLAGIFMLLCLIAVTIE
ncbi:MAG: preprotein translocase subunit SecG [Caldilineaceae bacterium]